MFLTTIFVLMLAIAGAYSQDAQAEVCEGTCSACFSGNVPVKKLNYGPGNNINIFFGQRFTCTGKVIAWKLAPKRAGKVFIDVWREIGDGTNITLVASSLINVPAGYENTIYETPCLPEGDQIPVQAEDIIGVHYPPLDDEGKESKGVIYYERSDNTPTFDHGSTGVEMSVVGQYWRTDNIKKGDNDFDVGRNMTKGDTQDQYKVIALSPVVRVAEPVDDCERTAYEVSVPCE